MNNRLKVISVLSKLFTEKKVPILPDCIHGGDWDVEVRESHGDEGGMGCDVCASQRGRYQDHSLGMVCRQFEI